MRRSSRCRAPAAHVPNRPLHQRDRFLGADPAGRDSGRNSRAKKLIRLSAAAFKSSDPRRPRPHASRRRRRALERAEVEREIGKARENAARSAARQISL